MSTNNNIKPNLEILQEISKTNVILNDVIDYKITITNTGNVNLTNLKLTDEINNKLSLVANSLKIDNIVVPDIIEINNLPLKNLNISEKIIVTFSVTAEEIGNDVSNFAIVMASYLNEEEVLVEKKKISNTVYVNIYDKKKGAVSFSKEVSKTICKLNDTVNFILRFKNIGEVDLEHVTVIENLDDMFTYTEGSTKVDNVITGNIVTEIGFDTLKINEEHRIDFSVVANTVYDKIPNTAIMAAYYENEILNPKTNEVYVKVVDELNIDGTLTKSSPKNNYNIGDTISFDLVLKNTGNITYDEVIIKDILSPNLEFINNSLKINNTPILDKNIINGLTLNNINPNEVKNISFQVKAKTTGNITNNATATITYKLNNEIKTYELTSNNLILSIAPALIADLEINKTALNTRLNFNNKTTVTVKLKNLGNTILNNVILYDNIPFGLELVENTLKINDVLTDKNINDGINLPNMNIDDTIIVSFDVLAKENKSSVINEAYATFSYINNEQILFGNKKSNPLKFTITEFKYGELEIKKTSNKKFYTLNEEAIFNFTVINKGNVDNLNVFVQDLLPDNYEFIENSITVDNVKVPGTIITGINIGTILKNKFKSVNFKAKAVKADSNILNTIVANSVYYDSNNNPIKKYVTSNSHVTNIHNTDTINLEFNKEAYRDSITLNDDNIFRINITNNGTIPINDIFIIDNLDNSYKLVPNSLKINDISTIGDITLGINIGTLNPTEKKIITFNATGVQIKDNILNNAKMSYEYTINQAVINEEITSNTIKTNIINDIDAILVIEKTVQKENIYLDDENTFTLNIQNIGNTEATNIIIKDILNEYYEFINNSLKINDISTTSDITLGINIASIKAHENTIVTFKALAKKLGNNILNTATGSYKFLNILNEPIIENIYSNEIITNIINKNEAILIVTKTASKNTLLLNDENIFTIKITNIGNAKATDIKLVDLVNDNYTLEDDNIKKGIIIDEILPKETKIFTYKATATKLGKDILNIAHTSYKYINSYNVVINSMASSNSNFTNIVEDNMAKLEIIKTQSKINVIKDETNTFNLTIKNVGNYPASNIVVKDIIPDNYLYVMNSLTYNGILINGDIKEGIAIANLNINDEATISFKVLAIKTGKDILNIATASYRYLDKIASANSNELLSNIYLYQTANLSLEKLVYPTTYQVSDVVRYKIIVKNNGNCPANKIVLRDTLPIELEFVNGSIYINGYNNNLFDNQNIILDDINPNETATVEFEVICLTEGEVSNKAEVNYEYLLNSQEHISQIATSNVTNITIKEKLIANLILNQNVTKTKLALWEKNSFTYTFINNSNIVLNNVVLNNYLNNNYTLIENTIRINGLSNKPIGLINNLPTINVDSINPYETKVVTFDAIAAISESNIINLGNSTYSYMENNVITTKGLNSTFVTTNILDNNTATLKVNVKLNSINEINQEMFVNTTITNIGDTMATNILVQDVLDDTFTLVPNSLLINNVISDKDILLGLDFNNLNPEEEITLFYKVIPKSIKDNAIIETNINYSYLDINNINRNISDTIITATNIINSITPNITIIKDSNQTNYLTDDIVTFRLVATNNGEIEIFNNLIKDELPVNYEFIPNSVEIDGQIISDDITTGIRIDKIEKRSRKIITYNALAKTQGINLASRASINYNFTTPNNDVITETKFSNIFITNIYENILPIINISKIQSKHSLKKEEINNYTIEITNSGNIDINYLEITDVLDNHYSYVSNTLKINNIKSNYDPNYIVISKLKAKSKATITFDVTARNGGKNISNQASLTYNYVNLLNELIIHNILSNLVISNITFATTTEIINLINSIANEEDKIALIIAAEKLKLNNVLETTTDKKLILDINKSIKMLINTLTIKEQLSLEKLQSILNNL